jgi:hypothetical protein
MRGELQCEFGFGEIEEFEYIFEFIVLFLKLAESAALYFLFGSNLLFKGGGFLGGVFAGSRLAD